MDRRDEAETAAPWELHLGPWTFRAGDVEIRPQMKFGGQVGHFKAEAGFSDVRDGLKFDWGCKAFADAKSTGHSLEELHDNIRLKISNDAAAAGSGAASAITSALHMLGLDKSSCAEKLGICGSREAEAIWSGAGLALERAQSLLSDSASEAGSRIGSIAQSLGLNVADLSHVLSGASESAKTEGSNAALDAELMSLRVVASAGLAVSAQMCLGWCDTHGYRMVGAGGKADAGLSMGGEVFAGWHASGVGMRIVLGIGHFSFEYHFPRAVKPGCLKHGESAAAGEASS